MSQEIKKEISITTIDNPFDPFINFNEWYRYDCDKGYNTCALIDRVAQSIYKNVSTNDLNEEELLIIFKRIVSFLPSLYKIIEHETLIEEIPLNEMNDIE